MHSIAIVLFKLPTLCLARRKVEEKRTLNPAQGCFWPSSVFSLFFFFFFPKNNWARFSSESLSVSSVFHCEVYWPVHCLTLWNVELSFYSPRGKGITWKLGDQCGDGASKDRVGWMNETDGIVSKLTIKHIFDLVNFDQLCTLSSKRMMIFGYSKRRNVFYIHIKREYTRELILK